MKKDKTATVVHVAGYLSCAWSASLIDNLKWYTSDVPETQGHYTEGAVIRRFPAFAFFFCWLCTRQYPSPFGQSNLIKGGTSDCLLPFWCFAPLLITRQGCPPATGTGSPISLAWPNHSTQRRESQTPRSKTFPGRTGPDHLSKET